MKMQRMKTTALLSGICTAVMLIFNSVAVKAVDTVMLPLEVYGKDVVSVAFPTISEDGESPFDFIIDPQELIYLTDAARYGGGNVEEGATLLFRNHEGEYDFSKRSDSLTVKNQSNIPIVVTITASMEDIGDIDIVGSSDFGDSDACSMYLALIDDEGNEKPISEEGEVSVSIEMRSAPDDAYVYRIDEENGSYSYDFSRSPDEIDFDSYSFGLKGYCNPNGNWQDISVHPKVKVTWKIEPVFSEEEPEEEEEPEPEEEITEEESDTEEVEESESETESETEKEEISEATAATSVQAATSESSEPVSDVSSSETSTQKQDPEPEVTEQDNSNTAHFDNSSPEGDKTISDEASEGASEIEENKE